MQFNSGGGGYDISFQRISSGLQRAHTAQCLGVTDDDIEIDVGVLLFPILRTYYGNLSQESNLKLQTPLRKLSGVDLHKRTDALDPAVISSDCHRALALSDALCWQ